MKIVSDTHSRLILAVDSKETFSQLVTLDTPLTVHAIKVHPLNEIYIDVVHWCQERNLRLFVDGKLCDIPESIVRFVDFISSVCPNYLTILYNGIGTENSILAAAERCAKYSITPIIVIKLTSSRLIDVPEIVKVCQSLHEHGITHFVLPQEVVYSEDLPNDGKYFIPGISDLELFANTFGSRYECFFISGRQAFANINRLQEFNEKLSK